MLTNELMGLLGLGILWVNTLLVAGAALARARELAAFARSLRGRGLREATLIAGRAVLAIDQVGRYGAGRQRHVLWHDRAHRSVIEGCEVEANGERVTLPAAPHALVWLEERAANEAAACTSDRAFDDVFAGARKARGHARTVEVSVPRGARVWIAGEGSSASPLLVASIDPIAWCRGRASALALAFVPAIIALAAGITWVALYPPVFGHVSMVGGGLALLFFLLVLPAGTAMRDWARDPHERYVRGRWVEPATREAAAAN